MEDEIRRVFSQQLNNFNLNDSTRKLKRNLEETLNYDYKVPIRVDDFLYEVEMLRKKILKKYMDNLLEHLENIIYEVSYANKSDMSSKEVLIHEILARDIKYDASRQIEEFMEDSLINIRRLSMQREYEYLHMDVRRYFLKYIEDVNEEILQNNRQLLSEIQNINYNFKQPDLEKGEKVYPFELLGVNFDEKVQKFWMYEDNKIDKKTLAQDIKDQNVYIVNDKTRFVINKQANSVIFAIFEDEKITKGVFVDKEKIYCQIGENIIIYSYKEKKISIRLKDEEITFDLNNMEPEKSEQLKQSLEEINPDVKGYFERIKVVPSYEAMFK